MSKKNKKNKTAKKKQVLLGHQPKGKGDSSQFKPPGQQSNIKQVVCIDCPKEPSSIVKQDECTACSYNDNNYCTFVSPKQVIEVVTHATPMKFNRAFFASASEEIGNSTRNYYLLTDIMHDVRSIKGYPNYSRVKAKFLAGDYGEKVLHERVQPLVEKIDPVMYLSLSSNDDPDIMLDGKTYKITDTYPIDGQWEIILYLYDMYSLDGFADLRIKGRWYKARVLPVENSHESLVVAKQDDKLIIGSIGK